MTETARLTIPSVAAIREHANDRYLTVRPHRLDDCLVIANYTPKTQFARYWNDTTKACRGLILRVDRPWPESTAIVEVVALPFSKFFNVGELAWPDSPVLEITDKLDGCLGILYRMDGQLAIATRGSFHSHQAGWATNWLRAKLGSAAIPDNVTLLFEIISPVSRIVVDYQGREECVLLGVRDRFDGSDWPYPLVREIARDLGLAVVPTDDSIEDVHQALARRPLLNVDREGWVIRCADGQRWKVKGEEYVALHRLLCHLSERAIVDALLEGRADDLLVRLPPEYRAQATTWRDEFERLIAAGQSHLAAIFEEAPKSSRKEFALWAKASHPESMPYLFRLLDGKEIRTPLLEALRERVSVQPVVSPNE